jgi:hypothetical protein
MRYLYRRGRIVTTKEGLICKVLARPGQIVYCAEVDDMIHLKEGEYVLFNEDLRMTKGDYIVPLYNILPLNGFMVKEYQITTSTEYEKRLRRRGIHKSPYYDVAKPEGKLGEIIVFTKLVYPFKKPRILRIVKMVDNPSFPLYELSNKDVIEKSSLRLFYRKPINYEIRTFAREEKILQS